MKPVVDGIKPPKMPKKKKDGLVSWIKSIAGIDTEDKPKAKAKPKRGNQVEKENRLLVTNQNKISQETLIKKIFPVNQKRLHKRKKSLIN